MEEKMILNTKDVILQMLLTDNYSGVLPNKLNLT